MNTTSNSSKTGMIMAMAFSVGMLLIGAGCESSSPGARSDAKLEAMAADEGAKLAGIFSVPAPNMDDISIEWGKISEYNNNDNYYRITIRDDLGNDESVRAHVRHEMFHAMTGLRDGEESMYHGVKIAGVVAWVD